LSQATGTTASRSTAIGGMTLKTAIAQSARRSRLRAVLLVAPLLVFLLVTFVAPIFDMLARSVENDELRTGLPRTVEALAGWDGRALPEEPVFAAFAADLADGMRDRTIGRVATRLNIEISGMRSAVTRTARQARRIESGPYRDAIVEIAPQWGDPDVWRVIKRESAPYTATYYLAALDLRYTPEGEIVRQAENLRIHRNLFLRTLWMSAVITGLALLLGYPVAYLLASLPMRYSNLLMIFVLLPFWTSLLVRTTTWIAILQSQGIVNDILVWAGVIANESRLQLIFNSTGTIVAMTHILLPFMILPLYSVMKTIPPSYMRAARSLGATPATAFRRIYVPQTLPGVAAGSVLVFILAIGYYITPALVGGQSGRFITNLVAYHMQVSLNWGLAAAIASILLAAVLILYWLYNRLVGVGNVRLG